MFGDRGGGMVHKIAFLLDRILHSDDPKAKEIVELINKEYEKTVPK